MNNVTEYFWHDKTYGNWIACSMSVLDSDKFKEVIKVVRNANGDIISVSVVKGHAKAA